MKKFIPVLIVALAVAAFYFKGIWLPAPAGQTNYLGYVEGETILIAAPQAGRVSARPFSKGDKIKQGDIVFSLDTAIATAEVERAAAAILTAQAQLANLMSGKRQPELDQIRALVSSGERAQAAGLWTLLPLLVVVILMLVFQIALRPYFTSRTQNMVWNGTRSSHISFDSQLRFWPLLRLTLKNWFFVVITLGLYFPFAAVATARMRLQAVQVLTSVDPDELLATLATQDEAAAGDAAGDLLGMDIGL